MKKNETAEAEKAAERTVLCYWCLGTGTVRVSARKSQRCTHCKGSGIILADTPVPGTEVTTLETALKDSVEKAKADQPAKKTAAPKRTGSSSRAAKKRTRSAARKAAPAKKAAKKVAS